MDDYSRIPKLYGMKTITTDKVMDKLDMFKSIFGKVDEFGWWDLERIKTDACTKFTSKEFQEGLSVHGLLITLEAPDQQKMNV